MWRSRKQASKRTRLRRAKNGEKWGRVSKKGEAYFSHLPAVSLALCALGKDERLRAVHTHVNRQYWTGTSLQPRVMWGDFSNANDIYLFLITFPHISLNCKLVLVQYQEYEYGLAKLSHL